MKKKILSALLCVALCFSNVSVNAELSSETASRYLKGILDLISANYKYGIEKEELYEAVIDYFLEKDPEALEDAFVAATKKLDDYSTYYNADELGSFMTNVNQSYVGIGVTVQKSDNGCLVTEVNKNGGAYEAGILVGDEIVSINGVSIKDKSLEETVSMIQGAQNTNVTVEVLRNDVVLSLEITRKKVIIKTVSYEIVDKIGYIKIDSFAQATADEIKEALYEIEEVARLNKIIIDVRNNPGGELKSVIAILDQFVPEDKVLVKFEYVNPSYNYEIKSQATFNRPPKREIVILANENSASASELFAGTMQYHKLAKVVGRKTFGKGSMQEMLGIIDPPEKNLGDVKLTVAEFLKPDGGRINKVGIIPDVNVKNKTKDFDESALTPMTISARYTIGDSHSDVLAIEERLAALGYNVGEVDGVYDKLTYQATMNFQGSIGLFPYGVMDYTTQAGLNDAIEDLEIEIDTQLQKAFEILK